MSRHSLIVCMALRCAVLTLAGWSAASAVAAEPDDSPPALEYRRVFVPAERVADWPVQKVPYKTVAPDEFERWVREIHAGTTDPIGVPVPVRLATAHYTANWDGGQLLSGSAQLQLVQLAKTPTLLALEPCNLSLGETHWAEPEPATAADAPAIGLDSTRRLTVLVDRSGQLIVDWQLAARDNSSATTTSFELKLPRSAESTLDLSIPSGWHVEASYGVVRPPTASAKLERVWRLELGGHTTTTLSIVKSETDEPTQQTVVRQESNYNISLRGIELSSQLELDVRDETLRDVTLRMPADLRLVSARLGEERLSWTSTADTNSGESLVTLHFEEPVHGSGRVVRLSAVAPLVVDQRWKLPICQPTGLFWQEGTATLRIETPLLADEIHTTRARQTGIDPLAAPQIGSAIELQFYEPDASVELMLRQAEALAEIDSVTTCEWSGTEISGHLAAEVRIVSGDRFALAAALTEGWNIKSVEATPAGLLADWHVEPRRNGAARLSLQLAEPISPGQPLQLRVSALRLRPSLGTPLSAKELRILRFERVRPRHALIALEAAGMHRLEFDSTTAPALAKDDVRATMNAGLFDGGAAATYYDLHSAEVDSVVRFVTQSPEYSATVRVEATVDATHLRETTTLECLPAGSRVDRVFIQFSPPRATPLHWRQGPDEGEWFDAERLKEASLLAAGFQTGDEVWAVKLQQPRSVAFQLEASRTVERGEREAVCLAILPEATNQSATVSLGASGGTPLGIDNRRLQAIPPPASTADATPALGAVFRYTATDVANAGPEPALLVTRPSNKAAGPAIVLWSMHVDSHYETSGAAQHVASLRLAQHGGEHLTLGLPDGAIVSEVRVDGRRLPRLLAGNTLNIPLAQAGPDAQVEIHYRTPSAAWGSLATLVNPLPLPPADVPQLEREWRFVLPSGMDLLSPPDSAMQDVRTSNRFGERWFGLFAWGTRESAFRPWRRDDWLGLVTGHQDAAQAERVVALVLSACGDNTASASGGSITWRQLVTHAAEAARQASWPLYVDEWALAEMGIAPDAVAPVITSALAVERGTRRLTSAGLVLLSHDRRLLLTSARLASEHAAELVESPPGGSAWRLLRDGTLVQRFSAAADDVDAPRFLLATHWSQQSPTNRTGVQPAIVSTPGTMDGTIYRLSDTELAASSRTIVRADRLRAAGWLLFVIIVAWGWPRRHSARGIWIVLTIAAAAVALVLPLSLSVLCSAILVGSLTLLVAGLLRPPTIAERLPRRESATARSLVTTAARTVAFVLGLACVSHRGHAAVPHPDQPGPYEVLIPVDAERRPTGARYQVPEQFYDALQKLLARNTAGPQGALIASAVYRGELTPDAAQQSLTIEKLTASLDLRVFGTERRIAIPFHRDRSGFVPASARLDGLECPTEWLDDGTRLALDVPGPGAYRLELSLQPNITATGGQRSFALAVPPVHASRLELSLPAAAPNLSVASAIGPVSTSSDGRVLTADLGPTDRLDVSWRESGTGMRTGAQVEVEELIWLQVRPGAVVVEARLTYNGIEPGVTLLEWEVDHRLRAIPPVEEDATASRIRTSAEQPHRLQFELASTPPGPHTLTAKFLYTDSSGVGSLPLPRLTPLGAVVTKRWLAVSVDPLLDSQVLHADDVSAFDAEKFLAAWEPAADRQPWRVFALPDAPREWRLVTRPKVTEVTYTDLQDTSLDRARAIVQYEAEVSAGRGTCFQHEINVPLEIEVDEVSVTEGAEDRVLRWSRDVATGRVTVLLTGAADGPQILRLHGSFACSAPSEFALPRISLASARRTVAQWRVFRRPNVLVEVVPHGELADLPSPEATLNVADGVHLVRSFRTDRAEDARGEIFVRTSANTPRVELSQFTIMRREKENWLADLEIDVRASEGLVDELQFRIPTSWVGPFTVNPAAATIAVNDSGRERTLTVRFLQPVAEHERLTIRGALAVELGETVRVPNIEPLQLSDVERFVALPRRVDFEEVGWELRGLVEAPRPEELQTTSFPRSEHATYRVQSPLFEANLRNFEPLVGLPQVHLADIVVTLDDRGGARGTATFLLEPAGLAQCTLHVPERTQLLAVTVDGRPALLSADGPGKWHVLLHHERLPQAVEVLFADADPAEGAAVRGHVEAPELFELPVTQTLWTIASRDLGPLSPEVGNPIQLSAPRRELARLASLTDMLEAAAARASDVASVDMQHWWRPWKERIDRVRRELERELATVTPSQAHEVRGNLARLEDEASRLAERISSAPLTNTASNNGDAPLAQRASSHDWHAAHGLSTTWSFVGAHPQIKVPAAVPGLATARRYVTPALLAIVALLLASLVGGRALSDWAWRWPHFIGVTVGLIWWLWLWPSPLGLLLAVASALLATRVVRRPVVMSDRSNARYRANF